MGFMLHSFGSAIRRSAKNHGIATFGALAMAMGLIAQSSYARWKADGEKVPAESSVAAGRWEGNVQIPGTGLKVVIDLSQGGDGKWSGSAVVPGFGVKGAALSDIAVKGPDVAFAIKGVLGEPKLRGRIDAHGAFAGDFQAAGNTARFVLEKTGPAQVEPLPQSTRVRKELEGVWQGELALPGRTLQVQVTLTNPARGQATAKFHLKGKKDYDIPVDLVTDENDLLTLESPSANLNYQGWFRQGTSEIKGELQLGPYDETVVLHRAAKNAAEPN